MIRITVVLAIAFALAAPALAGEPVKDEEPRAKIENTDRDFRYRDTAERLRGKPYAVRSNTQPMGETASEQVMQFLPAANYLMEGRYATGGF